MVTDAIVDDMTFQSFLQTGGSGALQVLSVRFGHANHRALPAGFSARHRRQISGQELLRVRPHFHAHVLQQRRRRLEPIARQFTRSISFTPSFHSRGRQTSGPRAGRTHGRPVAGWPAGRTLPIPALFPLADLLNVITNS